MSEVLSVAWYRFHATFGRRWGGYLSLLLLIGMIGGIAMASVAAARLTQSSYPTFLASTNPSDLNVSVYNSGSGRSGSALTAKIAHLADVKRVRDIYAPLIVPLAPDGTPRLNTLADVVIAGSADGELLDQDRLAVVTGRLADPSRTDEVTMTASAARQLDMHVGEIVPLGLYTYAQASLPNFGTTEVTPRIRVRAKLVGIVEFNNQVVQDDIDRAYGFMVLTPALIREAIAVYGQALTPVSYGVQLDDGTRGVSRVEQQIVRLIPRGFTSEFHVTSRVVAQVELAIKPESVALGALGAIAALVCLVLGVQAIARQVRSGDEDREVLRALGASPAMMTGEGLIGLVVAVVVGSLLALAVAVGLSPLAPVGPVRAVYPGRGIDFDSTVLMAGLGLLVFGFGAAAVALSYWGATHRIGRVQRVATRSLRLTRGAEAAGMSVAGVIGLRFALDPGRGRTAVPVRSALVGTAIAVTLVVGTLTFANSFATLVSRPALYGWNWNFALDPSSNVPPQTLSMLDRDPNVAAWTGVDYTNAQIDDQTVPILITDPRPKVSPPILSGHGLDAKNQVVLGSSTLALLHKHVGDTVHVS
ncbi:MAG: hypothetical protein WB770_09520 [Acidimicrobiales bacterium]